MWAQQQGRLLGFQGGYSPNIQFLNNPYQGGFSSFNNQLQGGLLNTPFQGVQARLAFMANTSSQDAAKPRRNRPRFRRRRDRKHAKKQRRVEEQRKKQEENQTKEIKVEAQPEKQKKEVTIIKRNRPILGIPLEIKWPNICLEDVSLIKDRLISTFKENVCDQYLLHLRAKLRKVHPTFDEEQIRKTLKKRALRLNRYNKYRDLLDDSITNLDTAKIKRLTEFGGFTMHALTRKFESQNTDDVALVLVHKGYDVRFLPQHVLLLCQLGNIPACSIEGLEPVICKLCDVARSFGVYFKKHPASPFQEFIDFVIKKVPDINRDIRGVDSLSKVLVPILKKNAKEFIEFVEVAKEWKKNVEIEKDDTNNEKDTDNEKEAEEVTNNEKDDTNEEKEVEDVTNNEKANTDKEKGTKEVTEKESGNENSEAVSEKCNEEKSNEAKEEEKEEEESEVAEDKSEASATQENSTEEVEETKKQDAEKKKEVGGKRKIELAEANITAPKASPKKRRNVRKK